MHVAMRPSRQLHTGSSLMSSPSAAATANKGYLSVCACYTNFAQVPAVSAGVEAEAVRGWL